MIKVNVVTLGYCKADMWRRCLDNLKKTKSPEMEWNHIFAYMHYPVDKENNKIELKKIADENGLIWIEPEENLGGCRGWNWAWRNSFFDADYSINIDPDSCPVQPGWDLALWQVAQDPRIGWASIKNILASNNELATRRHEDTEINGVKVHLCPSPMMLAGVNILRLDWIKKIGGQKQDNKFYGGVELNTWPFFRQSGYQLALLADYYDSTEIQSSHDPLYNEWKIAHAQQGYQGGFDEYIKGRGL